MHALSCERFLTWRSALDWAERDADDAAKCTALSCAVELAVCSAVQCAERGAVLRCSRGPLPVQEFAVAHACGGRGFRRAFVLSLGAAERGAHAHADHSYTVCSAVSCTDFPVLSAAALFVLRVEQRVRWLRGGLHAGLHVVCADCFAHLGAVRRAIRGADIADSIPFSRTFDVGADLQLPGVLELRSRRLH